MAKVELALQVLTGAEATAHAMRQIRPDVVPVYPITPQTPIIQTFSRFVADGKTDTVLVQVESEHSAMSAAVGSALAGARTMTATASQGLALMVEVVYIAAGLRAPVVIAVGNRALSGPINIHGDHSDGMLARDSGAVQIYALDAQEAYDLTVMAPRVAEHARVLLPVMVGQDGFNVTHSAEPVALLPDEEVQAFVGPYEIPYALLDGNAPSSHGVFAMPDSYFELRHQMISAVEAAERVYGEVAEDYRRLFGRWLPALDAYRMEDAERALILIGSAAGTAKEVVDDLRAAGEKVGLVAVRLYRPFPHQALREVLAGVKRVAVLDRAASPGTYPPLFSDALGAVQGTQVELRSYVYGLGGRDLPLRAVHRAFRELLAPAHARIGYLGLVGEDDDGES
ncbi:MAG: pyruvate ferredoxin oxidoreductase [Thermaerobacter sp.]|nr:pyruvate ferredoxin oxidoreductase [Thermaerobacter sp.]